MAKAPAKDTAKPPADLTMPAVTTVTRMRGVHLRAFEPIPFPQVEPGFAFNANFCRNPMCPNFGPAPEPDAYACRYTIRGGSTGAAGSRYKCNRCGMESRLLSNRSLRAAYVWFKRQSVPFAACKDEACANYGINAFEHWDRYERDRKSRLPHRIRCRACGSARDIGEPFGLWERGVSPKVTDGRMAALFKHVRVGLGMRVSMVLLEDPGVGFKLYQRMLGRLGRQLRDYQSYGNAGLMAPGYTKRLRRLFMNANDGKAPGPADTPFNGVATLRTDMMSVSLRTPTEAYAQRYQLLPVLMTALRIHNPRTWFLLAAHPCAVFHARDMPKKLKRGQPPGMSEAVIDAKRPLPDRRFDHLDHYGTIHPKKRGKGKGERETSYLGAGGLFMRRDYADIAHFMVLRDLTRRFEQVTFCMDGDRKAYRSAAAVFAGDLRTPVHDDRTLCRRDPPRRRVEIAVIQTRPIRGRKKPRQQEDDPPAPDDGLDEEWEEREDGAPGDEGDEDGDPDEAWEEREDKPPAPGGDPFGDRDEVWEEQQAKAVEAWETQLDTVRRQAGIASWTEAPEALATAKARLFVQPMRGAWSVGNWAWLNYPPKPGFRTALLWLSQGPDRAGAPEGEVEAFLKYASLQSVDSAIQVMRRRAPAARRPRFRADGNPSYTESSESLRPVISGIWLSWFAMNYARPWTDPERMPARVLGLMRREDHGGFNIARRLRIRLGRDHASEMTERIGNG